MRNMIEKIEKSGVCDYKLMMTLANGAWSVARRLRAFGELTTTSFAEYQMGGRAAMRQTSGGKIFTFGVALSIAFMAKQTNALVIDNFDASNPIHSTSGDTPGVVLSNALSGLSGVLGGERDFEVEELAGSTGLAFNFDAGGGGLDYASHSNDDNVKSRVLLQYDGDDEVDGAGTGLTLGSGLGANFIADGSTQFEILMRSNDGEGLVMNLTVHTAGGSSTIAGGVFDDPIGPAGPGIYIPNPIITGTNETVFTVPFAAFSNFAEFNAVQAFEVEFINTNAPSGDFSLRYIQTGGAVVPEPSTYLMASLGLMGLLAVRKKRKSVAKA